MAALPLSPDSARANPIPLLADSNRDAVRAAPRVPAASDSLAAHAQHAPTRRGILGAMAALPALAGSGVAAAAAPISQSGVSPELTQAIAYYRRASAFSDDYHRSVHGPACESWRAAVARIPHAETKSSFENVKGDRITLTTADEASVACSRSMLDIAAEGGLTGVDADYITTLREQVAAADSRDAERDRLRSLYRVDATGRRGDRIGGIALSAISKAVAIPARNAADLAVKIAFIAEVEWWDDRETQDAISDDARRLAKEGR